MGRNDREVFQGRDYSRVNAKILPARSSLSCHRLGIVIGVQEFPLCDFAVFAVNAVDGGGQKGAVGFEADGVAVEIGAGTQHIDGEA